MNDTTVAPPEADPPHNVPPVVAAPAVARLAMTDIFGKPPLLKDEDANLYDALFARVVAAARPRDPFEWILLKDYADLAWEIFRLRRAKAGLFNYRHKIALGVLIARHVLDLAPAVRLQSSEDAKTLLQQALTMKGFEDDAVIGEAVAGGYQELMTLEKIIASAETRRNAMLREIDNHRSEVATRLRDAPDVVDAETEDLPAIAGIEAPQA